MAFPTDPIYKIEAAITGVTEGSIRKACGGNRYLSIPKNPSNTDYAEYLEWVEAGNTPEEAD